MPLIVALGICAKNVWLINQPVTGSWAGMHLSRIAFLNVDRAELDRLVAQGQLSPLSLVGGFQPLESYERFDERVQQAVPSSPMADHPALSVAWKPLTPGVNFNNLKYVGISSILQRDSLRFILSNPRRYYDNVWTAVNKFDDPASENALLEPNLSTLSTVVALEKRLVYPWGKPILLWLSFLATLLWFARSLGLSSGAQSSSAAGLFVGLSVLWCLVIGNLLEYGENNRYRVPLDPLLYISIVAAVHESLVRAIRRLKLRSTPST